MRLGFKVFDPELGNADVAGGGDIDGAGTYISLPTVRKKKTDMSYQVTTTDVADLAGTLTVEFSNASDEDIIAGVDEWDADPAYTQSISGATTFTLLIDEGPGRVRLNFERSGGTGTITARLGLVGTVA